MRNTKPIWRHVEAHASKYYTLSDKIWNNPELNYAEFFAASEHTHALTSEGFTVKEGLADIPTAIVGEAGDGGPLIAILGEYDALPSLSQAAGVAEESPIVAGGSGHGCGHNMLGSASLLAAVAVKDWLAETGLPGRVRYYGCPAEEGGSSKSFLVRAGAFDDVDVVITWHPAPFTGVCPPVSLACVELDFTFNGRAAHAATSPHLGRSALDAVELMNVGVNYLREHMPSSARVHYAIIDGGGFAPNVVQPRATVRHLVRAENLGDMWSLVERVKKIADGAALMTETRVEVKQLSGEANLVGNAALEKAMHLNLEELGGPGFDDADLHFARQIQQTLTAEDIHSSYADYGLPVASELLSEQVYRLHNCRAETMGSTDVGTVSWVAPTVQCLAACYAVGTQYHSWQLVAQGKSPAAHKGLSHAAKAMAGLAADVLSDPDLLSEAKDEFTKFRQQNAFKNPIGLEVAAPLAMGSK